MILLGLASFFGAACDRPTRHAEQLPVAEQDIPMTSEDASPGQRTAVFAAGCFWCVEAVFQPLDGVIDVVSGYAGGTSETATYEMVASGQTDHAEVVQITYDPSQVTYGQLLRVFFATHDPTMLNRQGPDHGSQYRSAIFYASDEEKQTAAAYIAQLESAGAFTGPIVTTLEPLGQFYEAEAYHQDYARRNPDQPYIRGVAQPKVDKLREKLPADQLKPAEVGASSGH